MGRAEVVESMRIQAGWCERLDSPMYHDLLLRIAADVEAGGVCWQALEQESADPGRTVLPLRFLGGIHRRVLAGDAAELARFYPSAGGAYDPEPAWQAFCAQLVNAQAIPPAVQTNEVGRCCALLPGFLEIASSTQLPLRLLEIGCSAGLNLRWDRYRYESPRGAWGDANASVVFDNALSGPLALNTTVEIASRQGCDLRPVDPTTPDGRLTLLSFAWPDQLARFRRLTAAIGVAAEVPAAIECADAISWLERQLAEPRPGVVTVVFHSIVMLYFDPGKRRRFTEVLEEAGSRATAGAPLAWLSMERGGEETTVELTLWPGGVRRTIATAGFHGRNVVVLPR